MKMPYIKSRGDRKRLDKIVKQNIALFYKKGNLNYFLFRLFKGLIASNGLSYEAARNFIGDLECNKLELYRRLIAEYEDEKIEENGDV
jgi:hypothetical protein